MDYQKAIEEFKNICKDQKDQSVGIPECVMVIAENINSALNDLIEYRKLGTLEECKEAVEKQKAKEPSYDGDGYAPDGSFVWDVWLCPNCGSRYEVDYDDYDYCPECGQAIDWSDFER